MNALLRMSLPLLVVSSLVTNALADSKRPWKNTPDDFWGQQNWGQQNFASRSSATVMQPQVEARRAYSYEPAPSPKAGDTVFAARAAVDVKLGDHVIANVPQGTRITVLAVQGPWVGVNIEQGGHQVGGWILATDLTTKSTASGNNVRICR
jgi:hypothetical protein